MAKPLTPQQEKTAAKKRNLARQKKLRNENTKTINKEQQRMLNKKIGKKKKA